jgi:hypothetical protein
MQCSSARQQHTRLRTVRHLLCPMCCRYEEYVPRKKRREEEEAKLLRLQGVSVRLCARGSCCATPQQLQRQGPGPCAPPQGACVHSDRHQPTCVVSTHLTLPASFCAVVLFC